MVFQASTRSFDYVVLAGGTAGLTVTSRSAEDSSLSVAVIEADRSYQADNGNLSVVPGYCSVYAGTVLNDTNPLVDWGFVTLLLAVLVFVGSSEELKLPVTP